MPSTLPRPRWLFLTAAIVGGLATVLTQQLGQLQLGRNPLLNLRTEFWHDQLGYLAIAADVRNGHFELTEPVTMTGVSHYPRMYYSAVGVVARVLGLESVTAWNLVSFVLQFAAAAGLGFVAASLSRRWWVGLLAPAPFLTGTFAYVQGGTSWYTHLEAHAVLWGPFGVLFSNNAETAGLCIGIMAISLVCWAWSRPRPRGVRAASTIVAALAAGSLSSFQTYSFLTVSYLLTFGCAVAGVWLARRRLLLVAVSVALIIVLLVVGPLVAGRFGQLPTLVFGLLPALPGLLIAIFRSRGLVAIAAGAAVLAAAPQVLYTALGIMQGDPFLSYRVGSNHLLGIVSWEALGGAVVVLVPLIAVFVLGLVTRDLWTVAVTGAGLTALPLLAINDVWGANAEPYRFWIEGLLLGGVLATLGAARMAGILLPGRTTPHTAQVSAETVRPSRSIAVALVATMTVTGILWIASLPDWLNALKDPAMQAAWDPATERETAIATLAEKATSHPENGLLTTELCIDNRTTKVVSGSPVANYHLGMAWPADREAIDRIISARDGRNLDFDAMAASDTVWVLTDSNCDSDWRTRYASDFQLVSSVDYRLAASETISAGSQNPKGTISLWRVTAP